MTDLSDDARAEIRAILLDEWDPIGVREFPDAFRQAAQDEYDAYIEPVAELLSAGKPNEEIAEYLYRTEARSMGIRRTRAASEAAAARLLKLRL